MSKSFFGGDCKPYWGIGVPRRSVYSSDCPKDREERNVWLQKYKDDGKAFREWKKTHCVRVEGFASKEQAEASLKAIKAKLNPPCELETYEYANL